ncbi:MAG: TorF family putative porin [Gallionella sp.]|nr:TorF family putative porin [Gallionella sp.]
MMKTNEAGFSRTGNKLLNSLVLAVLAVPGAAMAADAPASPHTFTANVGFTTDYVFRGISQTSTNPAVQGGIDYSHSSGLYAGVWGSNVSWIADSGAVAVGSVTMELDTYFGIRNSFAGDFTYDFGFIRYNYLGNYAANVAGGFAKADTNEIYGAIGYKWITAKYSHGLGDFLTIPGARGTGYFEINASIPVADTGITLGAHAGKQKYKGTAAAAFANTPTYTDYKLGVSKDFGGYVVGLAYTDTNASPFYTYPASGGDWGKGTAVLSVTRSF